MSQRTVREWERGDRAHVTTEMLHVGAEPLDTSAEKLLARPDAIYTADRPGRSWPPALQQDVGLSVDQ